MPDDKISGAEIAARALELKELLEENGWELTSLDTYAMVAAAVAATATMTLPDRDAYVHMIGELRRCLDNGSNMFYTECFAMTKEERELFNARPATFTRH